MNVRQRNETHLRCAISNCSAVLSQRSINGDILQRTENISMENNSAANEPENKILSAVHSLNMMYNEKSLTTLNISVTTNT